MKTTKLLLALSLPVAFAACNNDELVMETPQVPADMETVVGHTLISNGLTIEADFGDADTRVTTGGAWERTDKLGLGWVLGTGNPTENQSITAKPNAAWASENVWANHLFTSAEKGGFNTMGNIYEGWHFAYYPYSRMSKVGLLEVGEKVGSEYNINPTQTTDYVAHDCNNKTFYVSPLHFLEDTDVTADNTLDSNKESIDVTNVLSHIAFNIFSSDILKKDDLKNIKIKKVTLYAEGVDFYTSIKKFNAKYLPTAEYKTEDGELVLDKEATKAKMTVANLFGDDKAIVKGTANNTINTEVDVENGYDLSGVNSANAGSYNVVRMFMLPLDNAVDISPEKIAVRVHVEGGSFLINSGNANANNAQAIKDIAAELAKREGGFTELAHAKSFRLYLEAADFKPNFNEIKDAGNWNACVKIASAMEMKSVAFTVTGDVKTSAAELAMPTADDFTVTTAGGGVITVDNTYTLPSKLAKAGEFKVMVASTGKLTVADNFSASDLTNKGTMYINGAAGTGNDVTVEAVNFINSGTIDVNGFGAVGTNTKKMNNADGEILVEYGSYAYPGANGSEDGTIAFEVVGTPNVSAETAHQINILISGDNSVGNAHVNELIVSGNLDLNTVIANVTSGDRYNSVTTSDALKELSTVDVKLKNGVVIGSIDSSKKKTVKSITAVEGYNTIYDVSIADNALNIDKGATLTVDGVLTNTNLPASKSKLSLSGNITNNGTLYAQTSIDCQSLYNKEDGAIDVATGYKIQYINSYEQLGTAKGTIEKAPVTPPANPNQTFINDVTSAWTAYNDYLLTANQYTPDWKLDDIANNLTNESINETSYPEDYAFQQAIIKWYKAEFPWDTTAFASTPYTKTDFQKAMNAFVAKYGTEYDIDFDVKKY